MMPSSMPATYHLFGSIIRPFTFFVSPLFSAKEKYLSRIGTLKSASRTGVKLFGSDGTFSILYLFLPFFFPFMLNSPVSTTVPIFGRSINLGTFPAIAAFSLFRYAVSLLISFTDGATPDSWFSVKVAKWSRCRSTACSNNFGSCSTFRLATFPFAIFDIALKAAVLLFFSLLYLGSFASSTALEIIPAI